MLQLSRTKTSASTVEGAALKQASKTGTFSSLFPRQGVTDATLSAHCMKKMLVVGVSSIAYLRNMFPDSAFGDRSIEDMQLKILREKSQCAEACQVVTWLKNIFPAIENRYVNKITVAVYDGATDPECLSQESLIEAHTFKFGSLKHEDYVKITTSRNATLKLPTAADFKANSLNMLRTLLMTTQALDQLPSVCLLSLKVYYTDAVPDDFQLDGFQDDSRTGSCDPYTIAKESRIKIEVGGTATHHDALKVYVQTNQEQFQITTCDDEADDGVDECDGSDNANNASPQSASHPQQTSAPESDKLSASSSPCSEDDTVALKKGKGRGKEKETKTKAPKKINQGKKPTARGRVEEEGAATSEKPVPNISRNKQSLKSVNGRANQPEKGDKQQPKIKSKQAKSAFKRAQAPKPTTVDQAFDPFDFCSSQDPDADNIRDSSPLSKRAKRSLNQRKGGRQVVPKGRAVQVTPGTHGDLYLNTRLRTRKGKTAR